MIILSFMMRARSGRRYLHATTAHAAAFKRVRDFFTFSGGIGAFGDALVKV